MHNFLLLFFTSAAIQKRRRSIRICYSRDIWKKSEEKNGLGINGCKQYYFEQHRFLESISKNTS